MRNFYQQNIHYLLQQKSISPAEFRKIAALPENNTDHINELIAYSDFFNIPVEKLLFINIELAEQKSSDIRFLVMDVDGVLSDGGMYYLSNGDEMKKFNTKDGYALMQLHKKGIKTAFLSSGFRQEIINDRASLLNIDYVYVGRENKKTILSNWLKELKIEFVHVAYLGDDLNDAEIMKIAGISACPSDASIEIKKIAHIVLQNKGGQGCVREFIDGYLM